MEKADEITTGPDHARASERAGTVGLWRSLGKAMQIAYLVAGGTYPPDDCSEEGSESVPPSLSGERAPELS